MNSLEKRISSKAHEFDIISLLRLLLHHGYNWSEVRFKGHNSVCSQTSLVQKVTFSNNHPREVIISLNLGLLSAQSPLPSYFRKKIEDDDVGSRRFEDFIAYFDHHLIRNYICNIFPEINQYYYPSWKLNVRQYLQIQELKSVSALHWLFQTVFPELGVKVDKVVLGRSMKAVPIRLGKDRLGSNAVFGSKSSVPVSGRLVTLHSNEDLTDKQIPWPREIKDRLCSLIFPLLYPIGVDLEINLVLKAQTRWARLHEETYLGYDRIRNGEDTYRRISIFRGHVDDKSAGKDEVGFEEQGSRNRNDDPVTPFG